MTTNGEELANLQAKAQQTETNELMYQRTITLLCIILVMMILFFVSYLYYRKRILNYRRHLKNVNARYLEDIEAYNQAKKDIGQLEKRIAEYQEDKEMPEKWNMQNMLGTTEVMCMHRIAAKGQIPAESNWQELQQLIMDRDKAMATALGRHQELNAKEIQICMLIRFRFLPSEISTLLDISAQNVTNMRQRLMQKMFQQKGGARDFDQMIRSL
jgi:DNA-binding CsgD family transcriptional regulator/cell division protein FtsL